MCRYALVVHSQPHSRGCVRVSLRPCVIIGVNRYLTRIVLDLCTLDALENLPDVRAQLMRCVNTRQVVRALAHVSRSLRQIGLPLAVRWTHLETTYPTSALNFTLGHCFHFRASLGDGCGIVVSALPGLQNHAEPRKVELQSAQDLQQFLLGEVCRQIVLTFGDITAAWTSGIVQGPNCFRIDLVPAVIHLLPVPRPNAACKGLVCAAEGDNSGWKVRVCVQEVS